MAIMMILDWEGVSPEQYARVNDTMGIHSDADVPDGLISHVAAIDDAGEMTVVDLWESEQALGQFVETRLGPALAEAGIPQSQPRIHPVHNQLHGSAAEGNVLILIEVDDTSTDVYDRMAAEMPEHAGDASGYPWRQHSVATDGSGFVVADLWPSEEAFGRFAEQRIGPAAQQHGMGPMRQKTMKVHNHLRSRSPSGA
jgi:heme-degrading monooxygenase HmoA